MSYVLSCVCLESPQVLIRNEQQELYEIKVQLTLEQ